MSAGHIQRRGKSSWRLKFEGARDPKTGKRNIQYVTVHGTKREAKVKLAELIAAVGGGSYVEPTKLTAGDHVLARVDQWEASEAISAERYTQAWGPAPAGPSRSWVRQDDGSRLFPTRAAPTSR